METKIKYTRYWIAIDSNGSPIINQVVARNKKPKTGEWLELSLSPCCTLKVGIPSFDSNSIITVNCGSKKTKVYIIDKSSVDDVILELNENYSALGIWSTDGTYIYLKGVFCPNASLEIINL